MNKLKSSQCLSWVLIALVLLSCTRVELTEVGRDEVVIIATASVPTQNSKMVFQDSYPGTAGIKSGWETGDYFQALEINGTSVTPVTFSATASADIKAEFKSSGAVSADDNTEWIAVFGNGATVGKSGIECSYSGQNGSLNGLKDYDYVIACSKGPNPDFKFSDGHHLSYLLRIKASAGVGRVEFNTCEDGVEWTVDTKGVFYPCTAGYKPKSVKTLELPAETSDGQIVYLAVPAIDYSDAGLIVTVLNKAGTKSQGKVKSEDFSDKGGVVGTFEMPSMIDRARPEDAIDFFAKVVSTLKYINNTSYSGINDIYSFVTAPKWAPFNIGASASPASAEDFYGQLFSWGETGQKDSYSAENYRLAGIDDSVGVERSYIGSADKSISLRSISGTKYDVARVKWGKDWRMPYLQEFLGLTGSNETLSPSEGARITTDTRFITEDVTKYNGIQVSGRTFSRNGATMFLPFGGRFYYVEGGSTNKKSLVGKSGLYYCSTHNYVSASGEAYRLHVRNNTIEFLSQPASYAFAVRPVIAADSDEEPQPAYVSGFVKESGSGKGIAGVTVSDGYNCCKTAADGSYCMEANYLARTIMLTVPSGYEMPLGTDGRPAFYKRVKLVAGASETVDFTLTPRPVPVDKFTMVAVADAHVQNQSNLARFSVSMSDIQNTVTNLYNEGTNGAIIGMALGDQLWDNMGVCSDVRSKYTGITLGSGKLPFFYVIGNHDHQSGFYEPDAEYQSTGFFVDNFAPTDYSFDIGSAHIIVLDDIQNNGNDGTGTGGVSRISYSTGITGQQLHWLRQDVENVENKENKVVLVCLHAPMFNAIGNGSEIQSLISQFKEGHVFSGHIHNLTNDWYSGIKGKSGATVIEHNLQSLSGMWWDADLTPSGAPAGYGVFTFKDGSLVSEYNKASKESEDFQIRAYSGNDSYNGYTAESGVTTPKRNVTFSWDAKYSGKILVRIWDGEDPTPSTWDDTWTVNFIYGGKTVAMTRIEEAIVDKCSASFIYNIMGGSYGRDGNETSQTWWMVDVPGDDPAALKDWKIEAVHKLNGGWERKFTTTKLVRNYKGYPNGSRYDISL